MIGRVEVRRDRLAPAALAAALLASILFYMHGTYGHGDITLYHRYALAFWSGPQALRSLPAEYPLLSLAPFTLTLLPPLDDFVSVFAAWMLLLFMGGYVAIRRRESARTAEVCGVYLVVGGFATVLGRYDLVPAAATVAAYWAARDRRWPLAYGMLALGTLLKLYPLFLLPVLTLEHYRSLGLVPAWARPPRAVLRGVGLYAGSVGLGLVASALLNPGGWLGPLAFASHRPPQVESAPATLLWLGGLVGLPASPDHSFHSYNLVGALDGALSALAGLALAGGCLWLYWRQVTGRLAFGRAITLCLLVVILTNRVFSPQYLIWVLPMVAITERDYSWIWLAIGALTMLVFPVMYETAGLHGPGTPGSYPFVFLATIALRNALLAVATARFYVRSHVSRAQQTPALPARSSSAA